MWQYNPDILNKLVFALHPKAFLLWEISVIFNNPAFFHSEKPDSSPSCSPQPFSHSTQRSAHQHTCHSKKELTFQHHLSSLLSLNLNDINPHSFSFVQTSFMWMVLVSSHVSLAEEVMGHWILTNRCWIQKGLSSLLHPFAQGSSWQGRKARDGGAASGLGVGDFKRVCVRMCVYWMQMWSWSCVVQSGCTRHATAEHSAEIIHQPKKGAAQPLSVEEQRRHTGIFMSPQLTHIDQIYLPNIFLQKVLISFSLWGYVSAIFLAGIQMLPVIGVKELDKAVRKLPFL